MEAFLLLVLIVLVIVANSRFGAVRHLLENQRADINNLRADLLKFRDELLHTASVVSPESVTEPLVDQASVSEASIPPIPVPDLSTPPLIIQATEPVTPIVLPSEVTPDPEPQLPVNQPIRRTEPVPSFFQRFLAENPDLEKFIGENLINKIGIAILVAGIGYFVKFAIDQHWINEIGRVLIGIMAGGLLLGLAHRLRNSFTAFSSVLVAGGLSVLYFTIAIAFSEYKIFSQTAAFLLMVVITGFAVLLSIIYNRSALAVMSLMGGFATPFMVSSGQGNYIVLLTYLLVLDCGMLVLAYFKKWNIVHFVAYGFTVLLYGLWLSLEVAGVTNAPYVGALLFATAFYLVFMAMNLIYNLKEKARFSAVEIGLLMSNTAFYYTAGMVILANVQQGAYQGLFTVGLAVFNLGLATFLYRREAIDRTLIYLLIGLVITFASLTIPVQLDGNFITMFWALEAVLLLWLSQRSGLTLVATSSVIVLGLMLISLTMDWSQLYLTNAVPAQPRLPVILNKAFITSSIAILSLLITRRLLKQQTEPFRFWPGNLPVTVYNRLIGYLLVLVCYLSGAYETDYQLVEQFGFSVNHTLLLGTYNLGFAFGILLFAYRNQVRSWMIQASLLGALMVLLYITLFNPAVMELLGGYFQGTEGSLAGYFAHYLSLLFLTGILFLLDTFRRSLAHLPTLINRCWPWVLGFVIVYTASAELFAHIIYFNFSEVDIVHQPAQRIAMNNRYYSLLTQTSKVGLPILWGLCAFGFMYLGLSHRNRAYRIMSLSLFAITLFKLFFYDLQGISEGGRIAAFISLGVLLLIISFMYQRIKRLILSNDSTPPAPEL
ncbi:DUF2339 domain-containing protein [Spirosoma sp. SC4-14]|uniref:DUF2339 domain-containing protein n=1 Tax=Spirosoma sp. SC4-14 TaxID=3128900 RepID=UPI0030D1C33F